MMDNGLDRNPPVPLARESWPSDTHQRTMAWARSWLPSEVLPCVFSWTPFVSLS